MLKRLVLAVILTLVLVIGAPGAALADGDAFDELSGRTYRSDPIWQGLCVGASLDLSRSSQVSCAVQDIERQANDTPSPPPNIGAGLCVGASLDLGRESAAKCIAKTQKPSPPLQPPNIGASLCVGASLDLSLASQAKCIKQTASTSSRHHPPAERHPKQPPPPHKDETPPPETPTPRQISYAALGDSVAAGMGLGDPLDGEPRCRRTFGSYANDVASARGLPVTNLACRGATLGDLSTQQRVSGPNIPPQLDQAFAGGTPQLITITAGANDIRWDDFLRKCYSSTCGTNLDERITSGLMTALEAKLQTLFHDIEQRSSGSPPEVIMTGYYFPLSDRCAEIEPRLTLTEIDWLNTKTAELNQTLENAAIQSSFASFVAIDFTGHDICSDAPWVQTLDDPAPFHPTTEGQTAIASAIN